jgi:hypothetical protein
MARFGHRICTGTYPLSGEDGRGPLIWLTAGFKQYHIGIGDTNI